MKLLKRLIFCLIGLVCLLLVISFFLPSKVHVERTLAINVPPEKLFEQVNTLKNWEKWSPWHKLDPNMKLEYAGPPLGLGAKYSWESKQRNVGSGTLTITESVPHKSIQTAMDFQGQGLATGNFRFEKNQEATQVTWSMETDMGKNPIGKFFGLMMEKMVGADFEKGLNNLKSLCEGEGK
jgi:uncharacterized protein YndB with AHSA1/START domain